MKLINTKKASKLLGVNVQRVRQLIAAGRLPAQKVGRDWVIRERDLSKVADRKHGRPRKK
jgi:excisionase family DNA binding protein